jgi:hypothetical protein
MVNKRSIVQSSSKLQSSLNLPRKLGRKSAEYVRKNYNYFQRDPNFFLMKTVARFELARDWAARSQHPHETQAVTSTLLHADQSASEIVATLREEGYCVGLRLSTPALAELLTHCHEATCFADRDPNLGLKIADRATFEAQLGRPLKLASYFKQQEDWPVFRALCDDPLLQAVATDYLGCDPKYIRSELAWSFPYTATMADKRQAAQVLHCDINDYRTIKFFFYLTDVGPENGPHAYIKKNPRQRSALHQLLGQHCASISESKLLQTYDKQLVTVCGEAGYGFAGDPYYFHRGTTPTSGERLLLQLEFGRHRYRTWYFDV